MSLVRAGFDVFSAQVDDKGIEFVLRVDGDVPPYYDIQIKTVRSRNTFVFMRKDKSRLIPNLLLALVILEAGSEPDVEMLRSAQEFMRQAEVARIQAVRQPVTRKTRRLRRQLTTPPDHAQISAPLPTTAGSPAAHDLQPHRIRTFKRSNDPEFAAKLEDIVGLYVDPPKHAVVLSVDEKSHVWMAPGPQEKS